MQREGGEELLLSHKISTLAPNLKSRFLSLVGKEVGGSNAKTSFSKMDNSHFTRTTHPSQYGKQAGHRSECGLQPSNLDITVHPVLNLDLSGGKQSERTFTDRTILHAPLTLIA